LRHAFGFEGCPILLLAKPRPKTVETVRRAGADRSKRSQQEISRSKPPARHKFRV
jgi:hypothetical protein